MAYFERGDERDQLVYCNICDVKCAERSIIVHKGKCGERHAKKFHSGDLIMCKYDKTHTIPRGQWEIHLEFCSKYQNTLVGEYQQAHRAALNGGTSAKSTDNPSTKSAGPLITTEPGWDINPNQETFTLKFGNMKL